MTPFFPPSLLASLAALPTPPSLPPFLLPPPRPTPPAKLIGDFQEPQLAPPPTLRQVRWVVPGGRGSGVLASRSALGCTNGSGVGVVRFYKCAPFARITFVENPVLGCPGALWVWLSQILPVRWGHRCVSMTSQRAR